MPAEAITLFSTCRPFTDGQVRLFQTNAITSWTLLKPRPQIILLGDDEGVAGIANDLQCEHVPEVACNEQGTPFMGALFKEAEECARGDILCYANADIILLQDFAEAVGRVFARFDHFLAIGQRTGWRDPQPIDFGPDWQGWLRRQLRHEGALDDPVCVDYFAFTRGLYDVEFPPMAVGRCGWDAWLVGSAIKREIPVVDMTGVVLAVHHAHPKRMHRREPEIRRNIDLVWQGTPPAQRTHGRAFELGLCWVTHATWRLTADSLMKQDYG